jgi:beta-glucosidase/6-phospho-beta-glucosidase/beta-galactosidase
VELNDFGLSIPWLRQIPDSSNLRISLLSRLKTFFDPAIKIGRVNDREIEFYDKFVDLRSTNIDVCGMPIRISANPLCRKDF